MAWGRACRVVLGDLGTTLGCLWSWKTSHSRRCRERRVLDLFLPPHKQTYRHRHIYVHTEVHTHTHSFVTPRSGQDLLLALCSAITHGRSQGNHIDVRNKTWVGCMQGKHPLCRFITDPMCNFDEGSVGTMQAPGSVSGPLWDTHGTPQGLAMLRPIE